MVMVPKLGSLSTVTRKLFNVILHTTQKQIIEITKKEQVVDAKHYFSVRLDDLVRPIQASNANITTHAKNALQEMRRVEVNWEAPDANTDVIWSSMSLLSEARIIKQGGVLYAYWALPPGLMEVIEDPLRFTLIDIDQLSQLKTYAAVALYEICARYKTNPTGVTSEHPVDWWVDALTQTPKIDPKTNKLRLRPWVKFKNEQGNTAIREINEKSDISIELIERKGIGKTIVAAQFKVWKKPDDSSKTPKISQRLAEKSVQAGIEISFVAALIQRGQSEIILLDALTKLELRLSMRDKEPIESPVAYLKKILGSNNQFIIETDKANPVILAKHQRSLDKTTEIIVDPTQDRKDERRSQLRNEILELTKDEQRRYAIDVFDDLKKQGLSSPTIIRKIESEEWSSAHILFNKMIEKYAIDRYNENILE